MPLMWPDVRFVRHDATWDWGGSTMLRHFGRADVAQPANSRAQISMRLLNEFRDLTASEFIRTVSA
jgi:hypothetical protein